MKHVTTEERVAGSAVILLWLVLCTLPIWVLPAMVWCLASKVGTLKGCNIASEGGE